MNASRWISVQAAATLARVAPKTIKRWCEEDEILHTHTSDGALLIDSDAIEKRGDPPEGEWRVEFAEPSPKVVVWERGRKKGGTTHYKVYLRFWRPHDDRKGGYYPKLKLAETIRYTEAEAAAADGRKGIEAGDIFREREEEVLNRARVLHSTWVESGIDPQKQLEREEEGKEPDTEEEPGITLARAFDLVLDPVDGKYEGGKDRRYRRELQSMAKEISRYLDAETLRVEEITLGKLKKVWRKAAAARGNTGKGHRWTERMTSFIQSTLNWLAQEELITDEVRFPNRWRAIFRRVWQKRTDKAPPNYGEMAEGPRYTEEEAGALFEALDDPDVDPRLRLLLRSGGDHLRGGQVRRCMRSDLTRWKGGHWGLGILQVPGNAQKKPVLLDIDPEMAATLDEAMADGYLRHLELAYQREEIEDYALFPSGRLRQGAAPLRDSGTQFKPAGKTALRKWMLHLEKVAGVEHKKGRLLHGLRRLATDVAPDFTSDTRILDRAGGWSPGSRSREAVYQAKQSDRITNEASEIRLKVRERYKEAAESGNLRKGNLFKRLSQIDDPDILDKIEAVLDDVSDESESDGEEEQPLTAQALAPYLTHEEAAVREKALQALVEVKTDSDSSPEEDGESDSDVSTPAS